MLLEPLLRFDQFERVSAGRKDLAEETVGIKRDRRNESIQLFRREKLSGCLLHNRVLWQRRWLSKKHSISHQHKKNEPNDTQRSTLTPLHGPSPYVAKRRQKDYQPFQRESQTPILHPSTHGKFRNPS